MSGSEADILAKIEPLMRDLFDEYDGPIGPQTSAADIEQWDSLANVQFIVMVEQTFGVRFSTSEIEKLRNLGEMAQVIAAKQA
ncbi:acyl carrier protein [Brevundimonas sp. A19_0]|uniref:acyl carrier protein n=1 Tax=Brevundimonas sp. A19_0 TaxID=2821087 RepID=UPI001AD9D477|nr:acyl carrier protein [Brevundimonas sp. A19_0]MBO9500289.1 acyl carrier protein [Brevundimonas sp. A19_0]